MTAIYTFDVFSSVDGFGSYDTKRGNWGGYWGKQGPQLLNHLLALYSAQQRMVLTPPPGEMVPEFVRSLVVAYVLARFAVHTRVSDWMGAVRLRLWLWLGFQAMAVAGSVIHENYRGSFTLFMPATRL